MIELLVVIVIIGILAGLAMPSIKSLGTPNVMAAASRQLVDDFAFARQRAITERANVYVVFFTKLSDYSSLSPSDPFLVTNRQANQIMGSQYAAYALYTRRSVGDQPGVNFPRYLTEWKQLPEGAFIPASEFADTNIFNNAITTALPASMLIPFPNTNLFPAFNLELPWIGFDPQGRLLIANVPRNGNAPSSPTAPVNLAVRKADLRLRIALGSAIEAKNTDGTFVVGDVNILETPPYTYNAAATPGVPDPATRIAISWLTGRARVEQAPLP